MSTLPLCRCSNCALPILIFSALLTAFIVLVGIWGNAQFEHLHSGSVLTAQHLSLIHIYPCGKVFRRDELEAIARLAIKYDAFVVTDEVYEHIVYAPAEHICMASLPGMFEHTITCNSLSKTYSITGWRLGYLIGPAYRCV